MNTIRQLSKEQRKFLSKVLDRIHEVLYKEHIENIYQFSLDREEHFILTILQCNEYSIHNDSDRLNSLGSLWGYMKNVHQHV